MSHWLFTSDHLLSICPKWFHPKQVLSSAWRLFLWKKDEKCHVILRESFEKYKVHPQCFWMLLGCVQAVNLAQILQFSKRDSVDAVPVFSGLYKEDERLKEAKNNDAVWEHRRELLGFCALLWRRQSTPRLWSAQERWSTMETLYCCPPAEGHLEEILSK